MSFFGKILASVGMGAATVDTKLHRSDFVVGEVVTGIIEIKGGNVEQIIEDVYLNLTTFYTVESGDKEYSTNGIIEKYKVVEKCNIKKGEVKEIPFSFVLPFDTPITMHKSKVWIHTVLGIKDAVDATDNDYISVLPSNLIESIVNAVKQLGFRLYEVENEKRTRRIVGSRSFIQEFEFKPTQGAFRGKLDELELVFFQKSQDVVEVSMQVDRKARGFGGFLSESLGTDETNVRLTLTSKDIPTMPNVLFEAIKRYA